MEKAEDDQESDREEHVHEIVSINLQAQKIRGCKNSCVYGK